MALTGSAMGGPKSDIPITYDLHFLVSGGYYISLDPMKNSTVNFTVIDQKPVTSIIVDMMGLGECLSMLTLHKACADC